MLNTNSLEMQKPISKKDEDDWVESTRCGQWYHWEYVGVKFREASSPRFFIVNKLNKIF